MAAVAIVVAVVVVAADAGAVIVMDAELFGIKFPPVLDIVYLGCVYVNTNNNKVNLVQVLLALFVPTTQRRWGGDLKWNEFPSQ